MDKLKPINVVDESILTPDNFQNKEIRREILRRLYGSIDDSTFIEQPEAADNINHFRG